MPDPGTVAWIASGLAAACSVIALWAWNHTHKRIDDMNEALEKKAENAELTRVRDTQASIFEQIRDHDFQDRERHVQIIGRIATMEGKLEQVLQAVRNR